MTDTQREYCASTRHLRPTSRLCWPKNSEKKAKVYKGAKSAQTTLLRATKSVKNDMTKENTSCGTSVPPQIVQSHPCLLEKSLSLLACGAGHCRNYSSRLEIEMMRIKSRVEVKVIFAIAQLQRKPRKIIEALPNEL